MLFEAPLIEVRENILSKVKNVHFANNMPTPKSKTALYILNTHICGYAENMHIICRKWPY